MWKCEECKRIFLELEEWPDYDSGECFGFPSTIQIYGCRCGSINVHQLREGEVDEQEY